MHKLKPGDGLPGAILEMLARLPKVSNAISVDTINAFLANDPAKILFKASQSRGNLIGNEVKNWCVQPFPSQPPFTLPRLPLLAGLATR